MSADHNPAPRSGEGATSAALRIVVDPDGGLADLAIELRTRLAQLSDERISARECGLADDPAYAADLDEEIDDTILAHRAAVILQLAFLRATWHGRGQG